MFNDTKAKYIVSKDSGSVGGFVEKRKAAIAAGAKLIVIKRAPEPEGIDFASILARIEELCGDKPIEQGGHKVAKSYYNRYWTRKSGIID